MSLTLKDSFWGLVFSLHDVELHLVKWCVLLWSCLPAKSTVLAEWTKMSFKKIPSNFLFLVAKHSLLWYRWPLQRILVQSPSRETLWIYERESAWAVVWLWSSLSLMGLVVNMYNPLTDQTDVCFQGGGNSEQYRHRVILHMLFQLKLLHLNIMWLL